MHDCPFLIYTMRTRFGSKYGVMVSIDESSARPTLNGEETLDELSDSDEVRRNRGSQSTEESVNCKMKSILKLGGITIWSS